MTTFNVDEFVNTAVNDAMDTKMIAVPIGEYQAVVKKHEIKTPKDRVILEVTWKIDDVTGAVAQATGRDNPEVRQAVFLDINDSGGLDVSKGKNISLGKLREALGLNVPGRPFKFSDIDGKVGKIMVGHTDPNAEGTVYDKVVSVTKL